MLNGYTFKFLHIHMRIKLKYMYDVHIINVIILYTIQDM